MSTKHESAGLSYSPNDAIEARGELFGLLSAYPATPEETERSLGLFLRGSLLARILAIGDLFSKIIDKPGVIIDLGTWRGQTAVLCENFRAIYEPLHFNRRIICFDTFEGYKGFSDHDKATNLHREGTYGVGGADYSSLLSRILQLHERCNAMGHNHGKHKVIAGDVRETLPRFFASEPNEVVALAFFDLNCLEPTEAALGVVLQKLIPGGICAFWQLTRPSVPAEGTVYASTILDKVAHKLYRSQLYPGLCYLVKE
jgi:hypothetical protein